MEKLQNLPLPAHPNSYKTISLKLFARPWGGNNTTVFVLQSEGLFSPVPVAE